MTSTDARSPLSQLFGTSRTWTRLAVVGLVALTVSLVLADFVPKLLLTNDQQPLVLWLFNGIVGVTLIVVVCTPILAIGYALWNRGPLLAFLIPITPALVGTALSGQLLLTTDTALALCSGTAATVTATCRLWLDGPTTSTDQDTLALQGSLGFSVGAFILSSSILRAVTASAGEHMSFGVLASSVFLAVATVGLLVLGVFVLRPAAVPSAG